MKRMSGVIVLILFCATLVFPQQEWQGRVARGGSADFPEQGYYAASNSFTRNSVVTVTNPATGKSVRVVITNSLTDNGLFMTLSADAAKALGLDGNLPVTMKAQPVIIPGLSDQSIGSELPFNPDPDINPAASAGDPNAFVFDSDVAAQNIRPEQVSPSPTPVAQASPSPSPVAVAVVSPSPSPVVQPSPSPVVVQASPSPTPRVVVVTPSPSPSDVDLGGSAVIGEPAGNSDTSRGNVASSAVSPSPSPISANTPRLNSGSSQQVAAASPSPTPAGQAAGSNQIANPATANPVANTSGGTNNIAVTPSPSAATSAGTLNQGLPGSSGNIAGTVPSPSPSVPAIPNASAQNALPSATNGVNSSPVASASTAAAATPQTGLAASLNDLRSQPRQGIASGVNGTVGTTGLPGSTPLTRPSASPSPSPSPQGKVAQGVGDVSVPGINQTQTGNLPGTTPVVQPSGPGTGMSSGVQSLGDGTRTRPNTGDVARPEHLFTPPKNSSGTPSSSIEPGTLASPNLKTPGGTPSATPAPSSAPAQSLLESQLARLNERGNRDDLFSAPKGDALSASLPGSSPAISGSPDVKLPQVAAPGNVVPDSSIAGAAPKSGVSTGIASALPNARVPGQVTPEASNPWLDGPAETPVSAASGLPLAQAVPNELPQAALKGAGPGITSMPPAGDLPMVAIDTSRSTADKGISGAAPGTPGTIAAGTLPTPSQGAAATVEDPMSALRPGKTIVSLEPADYRPPVLKQPSGDTVPSVSPSTSAVTGSLAEATAPGKVTADPSIAGTSSQRGSVTGDLSAPRNPGGPEQGLAATTPNLSGIEAKLAEAQLRGSGTPDASIAGANGANSGNVAGDLSSPRTPGGADAVLGTGTPAQGTVAGNLSSPRTPGGGTPDASIAGANGASTGNVAGNLSSPRTPGGADAVLGTGTPTQGTVGGNLAQAQVRNGGTADNGLVLGTPTGSNNANNLALADPTASGADTLKGGTTPGGSNLVVGINPAEPRSPGSNVATTNGTNQTGTNQTGTNQTNGTAQTNVSMTVDEAWAVSNLPIIKTLQKEQYYLQLGAFANPRSAKRAIDEIALAYPTAVLPEKSSVGSQVYKVYIGPLNEDEKGLILYWLRAKGYRDAFVRKGQP